MPAWFLRHYPANRCLFTCVKTPSFYCIAAISFTIPSSVCGDTGENLTHKRSPESYSKIVYAFINFWVGLFIVRCDALIGWGALVALSWFVCVILPSQLIKLPWSLSCMVTASPGMSVVGSLSQPNLKKNAFGGFVVCCFVFLLCCVALLCLSEHLMV